MKGKRVVWPQRGQVEIEEFDLPVVGENRVLVKTDVSLISPGTERAFLLGLPNAVGSYPQHPGYSNVGKVIDIGAGVTGIAVGDKVASAAGHASHALLSANSAFKVPDGLTEEAAVFFNLCAISLQGVRKARIELGEPVAVMGQGLIGLLALQLARLSGAFPVIAVDIAANRLKLASKCGADFALNPQDPDFEEKLSEITEAEGPSVVIEATGSPEPVNTAFKLAGWRGRVILLASTRGETESVNFYRDVHKKGLSIIGAHNSVRPSHNSSAAFWTSADDCRLTLSLLAHGRIIVDKLITHRFNSAQAEKAYKLLMDWAEELLGVILAWN
ncbi:MAG: zinc-binding dehydrogenase [Candidatus Poribacteria bacterium]